MRLSRLDLEKFGAFEALRLTFRPGARLHVVYGANEAGKSTALAAVGALLYGVPDRTPYAFRFPGQEMRIGGEILARDGKALAFRRRKGRKNTLYDEAGAPLADDALARFAGPVGEDGFHRSFGLDAKALREGGEAMLKADGDVGASLLEAASGLGDLIAIRKALEAEADALYGDRRAERRLFYQGLDRHDAAAKAIRASELHVDEWKRRNADLDRLAAELDNLKRERSAAGAERARRTRLRRAAPVLSEIGGLQLRLAAHADLPAFAPGEADALAAALDERRSAVDVCERAEAEARRLAGQAAGIAPDAATLAEAAAIEDLFRRSSDYESKRRDLPRVEAEADHFRVALERHARSLGLADAAALETGRPTAAALAALRALIGEGRKLLAEGEAKAQALAGERRAVQDLRRESEGRPAAPDPSPAREAFAALGKIGERARKAAEGRVALATETRQLAEGLARLDPAVTDLEPLAARPLPREEDFSRFQRLLDEAAQGARAAVQRRESAEAEMAGTAARLVELAAGQPLVTPERIGEARARRDAAWRPLRAALAGAADAPEPAARPALVATFETLAVEADGLADAANADAERLARYALETQRHDAETRRTALALAEEAKATAVLERNERAWRALWTGLCGAPRGPEAMRAWAGRVAEALNTRDLLLARGGALAAETRDLDAATPALRALEAELGLAPVEGLDIARLADRIERRLGEAARVFEESRDLETRAAAARRRLAAAETEEREAAARTAGWRTRADDALSAAGLPGGAPVEAIEAALEVWGKAAGDGDNLRNRDARVGGMKRDMEAFEADARRLARRCAPDAIDLPAETVAGRLHANLSTARKAEARRLEADVAVATAAQARGEAEARRARAEATIAQRAAALPEGVDLAGLVARERERAGLVETLSQRRRDLVNLADGVEEAQLVADMAGFDPDAAAAWLVERDRAEETRAALEKELYAERAALLRRRSELEVGVGAEEAWQKRRNAEAELVETARRWAVLKAASALIGGALDRHRAARRDPLMTRAGEIFSLMTGGGFSGLDQQFGEDDELQLVGLRRDGEAVRVRGLSEGTRDQLYLSLRLAAIERFATGAEAPPFVGDDLFASFDEARTGAGLEALAAISDQVQPIVFTHHRHVAEAAKRRLGQAADVQEISQEIS